MKKYFSNVFDRLFFLFFRQFSEYALQKSDNESRLSNDLLSSYQETFEKNTRKALDWIRTSLQALLESKPLPNKLQTNVLVFKHEKTSEFNRIDLIDVRYIDVRRIIIMNTQGRDVDCISRG